MPAPPPESEPAMVSAETERLDIAPLCRVQHDGAPACPWRMHASGRVEERGSWMTSGRRLRLPPGANVPRRRPAAAASSLISHPGVAAADESHPRLLETTPEHGSRLRTGAMPRRRRWACAAKSRRRPVPWAPAGGHSRSRPTGGGAADQVATKARRWRRGRSRRNESLPVAARRIRSLGRPAGGGSTDQVAGKACRWRCDGSGGPGG